MKDTLHNEFNCSSGFLNAVSITNDGLGNIYVLDKQSSEITKFDHNLNVLLKIGKKGWKNGEFDEPTYIDGSSGLDIYVSDGKNFRIQRFDLNLSYISSLITNNEGFSEEFRISNPIASITINSKDLYVVDGDDPKIEIFQSGNTPSKVFAGYQNAQYAVMQPVKIIKDSYNNLYILDRKKNSILKYDNIGNYIKEIKLDNLISISIYNDILYILSKDGIYLYDIKKNGFSERKNLNPSTNLDLITDFLIYNSNKYFILEKNKLSYFSIY